jgi:riboflavin kinase/FMN adenylyltransferase
VVHGEHRGAKLGFPTANIYPTPEMALPSDGIYATLAYINGTIYKSVTKIGRRPTFNGDGRTIEVYIFDFHGDLYDKDIRIDIIDRIRDEVRFDSVEALKKRLAEDVKEAAAILASQGKG